MLDKSSDPKVAVIDFHMGNLFSVMRACDRVGLQPFITHDPQDVKTADGIILPGVGAFGVAMQHLDELKLLPAIKGAIEDGKPFLGICLGMQLLLSESEEFGSHQGLGIIPGKVVRFPAGNVGGRWIKVPQVGWNQIYPDNQTGGFPKESIFADILPATYMYFVHSFYTCLDDKEAAICWTDYEGLKYCSGLQKDNICATQFHPEKSSDEGIKIYENWAKLLRQSVPEST